MSDQYHIDQIRKGDLNAFSYFVDRYKATAYSIALRIIKNPADAEEIVQEAFIKALQGIHRFKGESKFTTWLFKIVYNTSISKIRQKQSEMKYIEETTNIESDFTEIDDALKLLSDKDTRQLVCRAMEKLDETDFTILTLFYYEEKKLKEISEITGVQYSYLKIKLQRARKKLRSELKNMVNSEIHDLL